MFKKIVGIILIFLLIFNLSSVLFAEDSNNYQKKTIIIAGDNYFPPFEYVDQGVYKGFNIDIMRAIAIEKGLDIEIKPMQWNNVVMALKNSQIDAIQGIKFTESRKDQFDFSESYLTSSLGIFILKGNSFIKSLNDLQNKTVAIQKNDASYSVVSKVKNINIIETENQYIALKKLIDGEVDSYVGNRQAALYLIQKYQHEDDVKIIGEPINPEKYGIAVKKGNEELLTIFNDGLRTIKSNGTYDKIHNKWFGEEIYSTKEALRSYINTFLIILGMLLAILFIIMYFNKTLKNEVEKRTEEIKESDLFKNQIINSIFSGLISLDRSKNIILVNNKVKKILNYQSDYLLNKNFEEVEILKFIESELINKAIKSSQQFLNQESKILLGDQEKIIEYNVYPLKDTHSDNIGATITFQDVTRRKENKRIIQRKDKLESLGRLTANIAHEIRNPLTSIKTYIELIPQKINNIEFQEKITTEVPEVIERLNSLISDLLNYARPSQTKKTIINLDNAIHNIIDLVKFELNQEGIQLKLILDKSQKIIMDKNHFKQILFNLLLNSIEATKGMKNGLIELKLTSKNEKSIIMISDNGVGISEKKLDMIFEPFYTTKENGTGLGLAITQQLVQENNGIIKIRSDVRKGTTIILEFPKISN